MGYVGIGLSSEFLNGNRDFSTPGEFLVLDSTATVEIINSGLVSHSCVFLKPGDYLFTTSDNIEVPQGKKLIGLASPGTRDSHLAGGQQPVVLEWNHSDGSSQTSAINIADEGVIENLKIELNNVLGGFANSYINAAGGGVSNGFQTIRNVVVVGSGEHPPIIALQFRNGTIDGLEMWDLPGGGITKAGDGGGTELVGRPTLFKDILIHDTTQNTAIGINIAEGNIRLEGCDVRNFPFVGYQTSVDGFYNVDFINCRAIGNGVGFRLSLTAQKNSKLVDCYASGNTVRSAAFNNVSAAFPGFLYIDNFWGVNNTAPIEIFPPWASGNIFSDT